MGCRKSVSEHGGGRGEDKVYNRLSKAITTADLTSVTRERTHDTNIGIIFVHFDTLCAALLRSDHGFYKLLLGILFNLLSSSDRDTWNGDASN